MIGIIFFGVPVTVPAGMNEHCLSFQIMVTEIICIDGKFLSKWYPYHNSTQFGKMFQGCVVQIMSVLKTVKRAVNISAGITNHFNFSDLEADAFGIILF